MKAVLLTGGQGNQRALAHKLAQVVDLTAIVVSENVPKRQKPLRERAELLLRRVEARSVGWPFARAWLGMIRRYDALYPRLPETRVVRVRNINDRETLALLDEQSPDVVLVSGTNLVGKGIIERGKRGLGVLNLHTGISPYVKGGPNCTNWCLAKGWFHLIGSTVMWIDLGIDTGDLVSTERAPVDGSESLPDLHFKVMEHAHDLYVRAASTLAATGQLPRVRQASVVEGVTFYTRDWNTPAMARALYNFRARFPASMKSDAVEARAAALELVALPR
jgi:methionyl-tRNA formyltransferase